MTEKEKIEDESKEEESQDEDKGGQEQDKIDPTIAALMKDPDGIAKLLGQKRKANAEAKESRLKVEAFETKQKETEQKQLKEAGEFEKLSESLKTDNLAMKEKFSTKIVEMALITAGSLGKMKTPTDALFASRDGIKFDADTYDVEGATEAIEQLKKDKPYLFDDAEEEESQEEENKGKTSPFGKPAMKVKFKKFDPSKTSPHDRASKFFGK